jgi:hypothetical protein
VRGRPGAFSELSPALPDVRGPERLEVGEILRPPDRLLVPQQRLAADVAQADVPERALEPARPGLVEGHAVDDRGDVDPARGEPDLADDAWCHEVIDRHAQ